MSELTSEIASFSDSLEFDSFDYGGYECTVVV